MYQKPVFVVRRPQPMNAYMVIDPDCQVGIDGDDMYPVDEKGLTPAEFRDMLKKAEAERNEGVCVAVAMMQKNKKFQKEQLAATGVEEFVEFYANRA